MMKIWLKSQACNNFRLIKMLKIINLYDRVTHNKFELKNFSNSGGIIQ